MSRDFLMQVCYNESVSPAEETLTAVNDASEPFVAGVPNTEEGPKFANIFVSSRIEIFCEYFCEFSNRFKLRNCDNNKLGETRK